MKHFVTLSLFIFLLVTSNQRLNAQISNIKLSEAQKIEKLIESISNLKNAKFDRNGTTYDAKAAAAHLKMKWGKAGSKVKTARNFIDNIASKSSFSGKPYKIMYENGKVVETHDFFIKKLNEIEGRK